MQEITYHLRTFFRVCLFVLLPILPLQETYAQPHMGDVQISATAEELALVELIQFKLEAIRIHVGKPVNEVPDFVIKGATQREVFYQAVNLYQKTDRLAQEIARDTLPLELDKLSQERSAADITKILKTALGRVGRVLERLGIQSPPNAFVTNLSADITDSDLYVAILKTNQQINQLLEYKFSPSEVYQQVTTALHITLVLYERFPEVRRILDEPEFIPGKAPSDVFQLLLDCYAVVRDMAMLSGVEVLEIVSVSKKEFYIPSEVYDVATLLVSELNYIYDSIPGLSEPEKSYFPGRKYPSDVYQRASHLQQTLSRLHDLIKANPDWRH